MAIYIRCFVTTAVTIRRQKGGAPIAHLLSGSDFKGRGQCQVILCIVDGRVPVYCVEPSFVHAYAHTNFPDRLVGTTVTICKRAT